MNKKIDTRIYQMSSLDMSMAMADATRNYVLNVAKENNRPISETDYLAMLLISGRIMREFVKEIERFRIDKEEGGNYAKH